MASWSKTFVYIPKYKYVSCNQHGSRYKQGKTKQLSCCRISADRTCTTDLLQLILLSDKLDTPVRYDFEVDPQVAYIEVVSAEEVIKTI